MKPRRSRPRSASYSRASRMSLRTFAIRRPPPARESTKRSYPEALTARSISVSSDIRGAARRSSANRRTNAPTGSRSRAGSASASPPDPSPPGTNASSSAHQRSRETAAARARTIGSVSSDAPASGDASTL